MHVRDSRQINVNYVYSALPTLPTLPFRVNKTKWHRVTGVTGPAGPTARMRQAPLPPLPPFYLGLSPWCQAEVIPGGAWHEPLLYPSAVALPALIVPGLDLPLCALHLFSQICYSRARSQPRDCRSLAPCSRRTLERPGRAVPAGTGGQLDVTHCLHRFDITLFRVSLLHQQPRSLVTCTVQ